MATFFKNTSLIDFCFQVPSKSVGLFVCVPCWPCVCTIASWSTRDTQTVHSVEESSSLIWCPRSPGCSFHRTVEQGESFETLGFPVYSLSWKPRPRQIHWFSKHDPCPAVSVPFGDSLESCLLGFNSAPTESKTLTVGSRSLCFKAHATVWETPDWAIYPRLCHCWPSMFPGWAFCAPSLLIGLACVCNCSPFPFLAFFGGWIYASHFNEVQSSCFFSLSTCWEIWVQGLLPNYINFMSGDFNNNFFKLKC